MRGEQRTAFVRNGLDAIERSARPA